MTQHTRNFSFKVLTINTHKGFTAFNKRFILPELRDAVRTVGADIVCLQEVMGAHEVHPLHIETGRTLPTMNFWPTPCGAISPMAAMRFIRKATTVTRFFLAIPLNIMKIATSRSAVAKNAACSIAALRRPCSTALSTSCAYISACGRVTARHSQPCWRDG